TGSQSLVYFLTTSFRTSPDAAQGEVAASINAGPFLKFDEKELRGPVTANVPTLYDAFGSPIHYSVNVQNVLDPVSGALKTTLLQPVVYSFGVNKVDDSQAGTIPNDDIFYGK